MKRASYRDACDWIASNDAMRELHADLELLRARVVDDAISARERVHTEGEIAALERAIGLLERVPAFDRAPSFVACRKCGRAMSEHVWKSRTMRVDPDVLEPPCPTCRKCGRLMSEHVWKSRVDGEPPCPR